LVETLVDRRLCPNKVISTKVASMLMQRGFMKAIKSTGSFFLLSTFFFRQKTLNEASIADQKLEFKEDDKQSYYFEVMGRIQVREF
jgi:hypothetical protein